MSVVKLKFELEKLVKCMFSHFVNPVRSMSEQVVEHENHKESDLYIFEGLEGFEELNCSDDSILVALLDDLQEETLMTLLDDNLLAKDLKHDPFDGFDQSKYDTLPAITDCTAEIPTCRFDSDSKKDLQEKAFGSDSHNFKISCDSAKRQRKNTRDSEVLKRIKLDTPCSETLSRYKSADAALVHISHDHCYASALDSRCYSSTNSDEETGNEEGSSSDTGNLP